MPEGSLFCINCSAKMATYDAPEGFVLDPQSKRYYRSDYDGDGVRWVTWFDANTGLYEEVSYPPDPNIPKAPPPPPPSRVVAPQPLLTPQPLHHPDRAGGSSNLMKIVVPIVSVVVVLAIAFAALWFFTDILPFGSTGSSTSESSRRDRDDDRNGDRDGDNGNGSNSTASGGNGSGDGNGSASTEPPAVSQPSENIVGSWSGHEQGITIEATFAADGRVFSIVYSPSMLDRMAITEGEYTIDGDTINFTYNYNVVYNHITREVLEILDPTDPESVEFSISGSTLDMRDDDFQITMTRAQPSEIWSFNHRANVTIAQPPQPPQTPSGPSRASEGYIRLLSGDAFYLGFTAGSNVFEFYIYDEMLAIFMNDPNLGVVSMLFFDDGMVMVYYELESYVEMDIETTFMVIGEEFINGVYLMYEELIDKLDSMTYSSSGTASFQGTFFQYDEYIDLSGNAYQLFYEHETVVGIRNFIGRESEDIFIHEYAGISDMDASLIFRVPDHFVRLPV